MTLIYGKVDSENGFLIGDSLFTTDIMGAEILANKNFIRFNNLFHGLKIHILTRDLAVAYAGDILLANETIALYFKELQKNRTISIEEFLKIFLDQIEKNNLNKSVCDFLILNTSASPKLFKISEGKITSVQKAYIGDSYAHKSLQAKLKPYFFPKTQNVQLEDGAFETRPLIVSELEREQIEIQNAIVEIAQEKVHTVGLMINHPFIVKKAKHTNSLIFLQYIEAGFNPFEGTYNYSFLSAEDEPYGAGIYYSQIGAGFLFISGQGQPHMIHAIDTDRFKLEAKNHFDIKLIP